MKQQITSQSVVAYSQCPRKAFLILSGEPQTCQHEYEQILEERALTARTDYLAGLSSKEQTSTWLNADDKGRTTAVCAGNLVATCDALITSDSSAKKSDASHVPHLVVGTARVSKEQKLALAYAGHVVGKLTRRFPESGYIVPRDGVPQSVRLSTLYSVVRSIIASLKVFLSEPNGDPPTLTLIDHCSVCPFRIRCLREAEETDHLSLLDRMTPKLVSRYATKGVFTVNQLSYLFKPRRYRKRSNAIQPLFNVTLQALAIRTGKTYLHEPPTIEEQPVEYFLDIEGIPDQEFHYLVGLLIKRGDSITMHAFWADTIDDERRVFQECIDALLHFPTAPIYHYGSYEPRAFTKAAAKYGLECASVTDRFVNVTSLVFGKVYFPTRSNRLKDLGRHLGATWTAPDASGLSSLAWRYRWEDTGEEQYKEKLLIYNQEDCDALRVLTEELQELSNATNERPDVDFAAATKKSTTEKGKSVHDTFDRILQSAHLKYEQKRIRLRSDKRKVSPVNRKRSTKRPGQSRKSLPSRAGKVIRVPRKRKCQHCPDQKLRPSKRLVEHSLLDLTFTRSGCRTIVVKYIGNRAFCPVCTHYYPPPGINRLRNQVYGRNFRCWTAYARIVLRLPIRVISDVSATLFNQHIPSVTVSDFVASIAREYASVEQLIESQILESPVMHVDETKINIRGFSYYAWVLTDGEHVVFKLSPTREMTMIQPLLDKFDGVLVSDFYGGYDGVDCRQQKCLVHLIRDLNDDLWKNPFNEEYEAFVSAVRDLLVPIFTDVDRYGLKARYLKKHLKAVAHFYNAVIETPDSKWELIERYKKRFKRYRDSLFLFLSENGIPWNNNMAERAIRHLAVQMKISGCFFGSAGAADYLRLLGIRQTCRFQDKSFLQFLLSGELNVDEFKSRKRPR
ncbi:MAG: putative RecB family nuclease [Planctomycetaceae bacterium]|jgi:predicted RecB family nuclease